MNYHQKEGVKMAVITRNEINSVNAKCNNGWMLDEQYYMYHNERTLIKQISIDDEHYLEFKLCYNSKKQIVVHIAKYRKEPNEQCAITSGIELKRMLDESLITQEEFNKMKQELIRDENTGKCNINDKRKWEKL